MFKLKSILLIIALLLFPSFILPYFLSIQITLANYETLAFLATVFQYKYVFYILIIISLLIPPMGNNTYRNYYLMVVKDLVSNKIHLFYCKQLTFYDELRKSIYQECLIQTIPRKEVPESMIFFSQEGDSDLPNKARMNIYFNKKSIKYKN